MNKPFPLRVGVCMCPCSKQNLGSIDGKRLFVPTSRLTRRRISLPWIFEIQEYPIPEKRPQALREFQCHFDWDTHKKTNGLETQISLLTLDPRLPALALLGQFDPRFRNVYHSLSWGTITPILPEPQLVLNVMQKMLCAIYGKGLMPWLRDMTPSGWSPPDALTKL